MADHFNQLDQSPSASDVGAVPVSLMDAKGDLIAATATDTPARLGIGVDGFTLTADSSQLTGLAWQLSPWSWSGVATGEEVIPRYDIITSSGLTSGTVHLGYFKARKAETVIQLRTGVDNAGSSGLTLAKMGVYSVAGNGDLTLIGQTASDTSLWNSTYTQYTRSLAASFSKMTGQMYAFAVLAIGSGMPVLRGVQISDYDASAAPRLAGKLAGQVDLPSSISAGSVDVENKITQGYVLP